MVEHRPAARGFTLIEMMVALAVLSLAALALIRLEGATIRSTQTLEANFLARLVARNIAVETMTDARAPVNGITRGVEQNGGRPWTWTRSASPIGDGGAMLIEVSVADLVGNSIGRLVVVRPADQALPAPPAARLPGAPPPSQGLRI